MNVVTHDMVASDPEVRDNIDQANRSLGVIGYTEHGERHLGIVSKRAKELLTKLGKDERTAELSAIASRLHDIGNVVNRRYHGMFGAVLAKPILMRLGMPFNEIHQVINAIGNHNEGECDIVSDISAALILADKSDVHFTRVRITGDVEGDIHDRVNFAAKSSDFYVRPASQEESKEHSAIIGIEILIDPNVSTVMEYFQIFLARMDVCKRAAEFLGCKFELIINGVKLA